MSSKEKAKELIEMFNPFMYCYLGSGMLTNTYDEDVALHNAKRAALIAVSEILEYHDSLLDSGLKNVHMTMESPVKQYNDVLNPLRNYLEEVKTEIHNFKWED